MGTWISQNSIKYRAAVLRRAMWRSVWRQAVRANFRGANGGLRATTTLSELLEGDVRTHRAWKHSAKHVK